VKTNPWRGLLVTGLTLAAGSNPRHGVPPRQLSEDELTSFLADEQTATAPPADAS
jgi:hypothetical protein